MPRTRVSTGSRSWVTGLNRLLDAGHDVTAVIAMNDRVAFGVYQAAQERGLRIPSDLSVVSFDDEEIASYLRPGRTRPGSPTRRWAGWGWRWCSGCARPVTRWSRCRSSSATRCGHRRRRAELARYWASQHRRPAPRGKCDRSSGRCR
ncbi:MAG: substrate-binding domain-containing protein [Micropruina sp.]|nr:substrate-binding domain-containing protein [Micropruina sp.]